MPDATLLVQAGAGAIDASYDPRLGVCVVKIRCWAPDLITGLTAPTPTTDAAGNAIGVNLPEWRPRTVTMREDGQGYDVNCTLEGVTSSGAVGVIYSLEGTTEEQQLETHWNLPVIEQVYSGTLDSNNKVQFPQTINDGQLNPMFGADSYYLPRETWNQTFTSSELPVDLLSKLGAIDTPPGDPPSLYQNATWLLIRVRATQRGNVWQIEKSWALSGPNGWIPEVYAFQN